MPTFIPRRLFLASASPRRQQIIRCLGVPFVAQPTETDEGALPGEPPATTAWRLALAKAEAGERGGGAEVVIGADTVVALEGEALGKPADAQEALNMLRRLRGRQHTVISGLAILDHAGRRGFVSTTETRVWMRRYTEPELADYVASGDPLDKAGAYAIQSAQFSPVERIDGCYLNVVGLPLCELARGLQAIGFDLPEGRAWEEVCQQCGERLR